MKNLSDQLVEIGVKKIVFVDFISMYPRTSRENIRVNFLLQQLKYVFGPTFNVDKSFYKGFMQPQELYLLLKKDTQAVVQALIQETGLRLALFVLLQRNTKNSALRHLERKKPSRGGEFIRQI